MRQLQYLSTLALFGVAALLAASGCSEADDASPSPNVRTLQQESARQGHGQPPAHRASGPFSEIALQQAVDINPDPNIFETRIRAQEKWVDIGDGRRVRMFTYNGTVPGPLIRVKKGDRVIVHFKNKLPAEYPTTIHWHGVEVNNAADGTPVTQKAVKRNETFTYDFEVPREGIYWYHPHIRGGEATFQGLYAPLVVEDPTESDLGLPQRDLTLVLSDVDVDEDGSTQNPNDVSHMELMNGVEGDTVMVNGRVLPTIRVRAGEPLRLRLINSAIARYFRLSVPGHTLHRIGGANGLLEAPRVEGGTIQSSMNMAMKTDGTMEMLPPATMDLGYDRGEILLPTAQRADVVFIPQGEQGDELYLMWKDYDRGRHHMDHGGGGMNDGMSGGGHGMGGGHNNMRPSIRLMRMVIEGDDDDDDTYTLPSTLRPVEDIRPLTNDDAFVGMPSSPDQAPTEGKRLALQEEMPMVMGPDGQMQMGAPKFYIDGVSWKLGEHMAPDGSIPDLAPSARRVNVGDVMEWEVHNHTEMHHPFHAHGFSFQPIKWTKMDHHPDNPDYSMVMTTFPIAHTEWADTWNIPEHTSLHYKVRFDARNNPDGSPGGSLGRWLYHCHIFQHAGGGMMSEFVVEPEEAP